MKVWILGHWDQEGASVEQIWFSEKKAREAYEKLEDRSHSYEHKYIDEMETEDEPEEKIIKKD